MTTLPDFSDLLIPDPGTCRNHCIVYKLTSIMDSERAGKVIAAINAREFSASEMSRRFAAANLPIGLKTLNGHRAGSCVCCQRHGTLG